MKALRFLWNYTCGYAGKSSYMWIEENRYKTNEKTANEQKIFQAIRQPATTLTLRK
jgi:hypothetical protein